MHRTVELPRNLSTTVGKWFDEYIHFRVVSRYPPEDDELSPLPTSLLPKYCLPGGFLLTEEKMTETFFHFALGNGSAPVIYFGMLSI